MSELRERISNKANDMLSELAHRIEGAKRLVSLKGVRPLGRTIYPISEVFRPSVQSERLLVV